jgi:starch phosphorylase
VHPRTWTPRAMAALFDKYVATDWDYAGAELWQGVWSIPDDVLWRTRQELRAGLVRYVRRYLPAALLAEGWAAGEVDWAGRVLNPDALTVVVARRAAEYKETDLLVSYPDRLRALVCDAARPVNLIFAGLAHPRDDGGKRRIQHIVETALDPALRANVVFLPGYDMLMARQLLAGADVWLNHPRRGDEACGTSFMKSVYSGGRVLSTADGGADELIVPGYNGWIIGDRTFGASRQATADSLYHLLTSQVVPEFHDRDEGGVPAGWVSGVKRSLASLGWQVSAGRMVERYEQLYRDAARPAA